MSTPRTRSVVYRAAMGKPWGALADWLDLKFPNDKNPEVQRDLRALAKACAADAKSKGKK